MVSFKKEPQKRLAKPGDVSLQRGGEAVSVTPHTLPLDVAVVLVLIELEEEGTHLSRLGRKISSEDEVFVLQLKLWNIIVHRNAQS